MIGFTQEIMPNVLGVNSLFINMFSPSADDHSAPTTITPGATETTTTRRPTTLTEIGIVCLDLIENFFDCEPIASQRRSA